MRRAVEDHIPDTTDGHPTQLSRGYLEIVLVSVNLSADRVISS